MGRVWATSLALVALASSACGGATSNDVGIPYQLDFGSVDCASIGESRELEISARNGALDWSAAVAGPFTIVGTTAGHLDADAHAKIVVAANDVQSAHEGELVQGTLRLTVDDVVHDVALRLTTRGTELQVPTLVEFGVSDGSVDRPVQITNVGTHAASVSLGLPSTTNFRRLTLLGEPDGFRRLPPGTSAQATFQFYPLADGVLSATVPVTYEGGVCGYPPKTVELRGRSSFTGPLKISPDVLDFGVVDCGSAPIPRTFTLSNVGSQAFAFSIVSNAPAFPLTGNLAPQGSAEIKVSPPVIDGASFPPMSIVVKTNLLNDSPHPITVQGSMRGAALSFAPIDLGKIRIGTTASSFVSVTNSGTASVSVRQVIPFSPVTTIAPGTSNLPLSLVAPNGVLGAPLSTNVDYAVVGGALCQPQVSAKVGYRLFDAAYSMSAASGIVCAASTSGNYCEGSSQITGLGLGGSPFPTTRLNVPVVINAPIFAGTDGICAAGTCWFADVSGTKSIAFQPNVSGDSNGSFGACRTFPELRCVGRNWMATWGDPNVGSALLLDPDLGMGGQSVSGFAFSVRSGFAVSNGLVLVAGKQMGGNLGPSIPDGFVTPFATLSGIADATRAAAFADGGCVTRANGAVSCWSVGMGAPADRGGFVDAVAIAAINDKSFCVVRQGGGVSCYDNGAVNAIGGVSFPAQRIASGGSAIWILDAAGRVVRIRPLPLTTMTGFDAP